MRKTFLIAFLLLATPYTWAQGTPEPKAIPGIGTSPSPEDADVSLSDLAADASEIRKAVLAYRAQEESTTKRLALAALLALIFKGMLDVLKLSGPFWKGRKGKNVLKASTLMLGLLMGLFAQIGMGMPWSESLLLALSGPGAMVMHEIGKMFTKQEPTNANTAT
jgi:hypothetical protein